MLGLGLNSCYNASHKNKINKTPPLVSHPFHNIKHEWIKSTVVP